MAGDFLKVIPPYCMNEISSFELLDCAQHVRQLIKGL
jgi:hypothetical protein